MAIEMISPCYRWVKTETILFSLWFIFLKGSFIFLYLSFKIVTLLKAVSFDKDNNQAVGFNANMFLINVLLDDSVVITINFSQPSTENFLEPD